MLNQFEGGEEVADFEDGGFRGVRAVGAIVADAGAEGVANGAGRGFLGIGGAHGVAPLEDGVFGFKDQGEDFAGTHEIGKLGEEGLLFVDGVEATGLFFRQAHALDRNDFETCLVNPSEDFTLLAATDGVGLDDCESALD